MGEVWLNDNALSGSIPSEVGYLRNLIILNFENNATSGRVPTEIGQLDGLEYLNLGDNALTELPSEIGLLTNHLQILLLGGNRLSGLPTEVLQLTNLRELEVSRNLLSEEEVNNVLLGLGFSCNETAVEMILTTDEYPEETTWKIATGDGTIVASGDGYSNIVVL